MALAKKKSRKNRYAPGQRMKARGEEWQIESARIPDPVSRPGVWVIEARALSGICLGKSYCFMTDLDTDIEVIDPSDIEPVAASKKNARLYWEANLRRLLPRNGALYLGEHGAVDAYNYQLKPAAHALQMDRPRVLLGDAVGLGKTIECGILLSELIRRGKARRVLCAVPKAILEQFQNEMWGRFSIPFHRLDSRGIQKLRQDLPSAMNPFYHYDKAIISIDTLKIKSYQKWLEDCDWDVLIIDECHNVADRTSGGGGSARHRTAKKLAERAHAVILMSATPHDGTKHGFSSLIKLLDRTCIKSDDNFKFEDFSNHFIRRTRNTDYIKEELASQDVGTRKQFTHKVPLSAKEVDLLSYLHDLDKRSEYFGKSRGRGGAKELFKTTLIKSYLSSPAALKQTASKRLNDLEKRDPPDPQTASAKNALRDILVDIEKIGDSSRLEHLGAFLEKNPASNNSRVVIFTERIKTMEMIAEFLIRKGFVGNAFDPKGKYAKGHGKKLLACAKGSMSDVDLNAVVKSFQSSNSGLEILVATNVASEGLNLHQNCHRLIHFDLPWSMIRLEQRNGRIDRLGQTKTPEIYYFASVADKDGKEAKAKDLKDDFWIVDKIQARLDIAAHDMAEASLSRFNDALTEETVLTRAYEGDAVVETSLGESGMGWMDELDSLGDLEIAAQKVERKKLPTLYEKSPVDFVREVCKATSGRLEFSEYQTSALKLEQDRELSTELQSWPREYRPSSQMPVVLEQRKQKMIQKYLSAVQAGDPIDRSYLNEIHPLMALLENAAIGLFPGRKVPILSLKPNKDDRPETLYFLMQSSLYNIRNDVVMQYWQVLKHTKGSPKLVVQYDMQDNQHASQVCGWLNSQFSRIKARKNIEDRATKRIQKQTQNAVAKMSELTAEARTGRSQKLRGRLKAELARIKEWEHARKSFLDDRVSGNDGKHAGVFQLKSAARQELKQIEKDSKKYQQFVTDYLSTGADADIKILGCLVVE